MIKIGIGFLYVTFEVLYLSPLIPSTDFWYGMNIISHIAFVGYLSHLVEGMVTNTYEEKLFFSYLKWLSLANVLYLGYCNFKDVKFAIYNTPIFAYIMGIGFIVFMVHCAINQKR